MRVYLLIARKMNSANVAFARSSEVRSRLPRGFQKGSKREVHTLKTHRQFIGCWY
jgi:hypothetical protein